MREDTEEGKDLNYKHVEVPKSEMCYVCMCTCGQASMCACRPCEGIHAESSYSKKIYVHDPEESLTRNTAL